MSEDSEQCPKVVILAGPNGAGKTTASPYLLRGPLEVSEFVNADVIARGLSAFNPESVAVAAARIMLNRLDELAAAGVDFAFETTLASRSFRPRIQNLLTVGYQFHLAFLYLHDPAQAVARVLQRVAAGGHNVPKETILRRHERGIRNFFELFQELTDGWYMYDNSVGGHPRLIASGSGKTTEVVRDEILWAQIQDRYASKQ